MTFSPDFSVPALLAGLLLSLSLIMAIGPQNAHLIRVGLLRQHLWLTVAVCAVSDVALIGIGVAGLAQLGSLDGWALRGLTAGGAVVLLIYAAQAGQRFARPPAGTLAAVAVAEAPPRRQAVAQALALSWLNPHAWLDTAVLIGSASLAYGHASAAFGVGAAIGSALWFVALGGVMACVGAAVMSPRGWRALDGLVALMMAFTACSLLATLV
jgi:L-lysine exporter family protein LysE/ArgO